MADTKVWCLLIDLDHKPTFGEPFPVSMRPVDTIHELKIKICADQLAPAIHAIPNSLEIWKCKTSKLSAKDSFYQTKEKLDAISSSGNWKSHVQQFGAAQKAKELEFEDNELLLVVCSHEEEY